MGLWDKIGSLGHSIGAILFGANWNVGASTDPPRPEGLDFAQTKKGSPLPLVYGTVRVDSGVLLWSGNEDAVSDGADGFIYKLDMLLGLGVPSWDESAPPYNSWRVTNPPKLGRFWYGDIAGGGDSTVIGGFVAGESGIAHGDNGILNVDLGSGSGRFRQVVQFFDGRSTQSLADGPIHIARGAMTASGVDIDLIPGYRNQLLASITHLDGFGASPRVAKCSFEVQSLGPQPVITTSGGLTFANANPAWVIYDLMCGKVWKMGIDPTRIDLVSFQTAAATLLAEGHGISLVIYQTRPAKQVIGEILEQVSGGLFEDPSTGLINIRLRRADYDPNLLQVMGEDNTLEKPELTYVGGSDLKNQSIIHFTNPAKEYIPDVARDQRLGNAVGQSNRIRTLDVERMGIADPVLAAKIASRDLNFVSRPLIGGTAILNREFYAACPENIFKSNWPKWNCVGKVFRVIEVDDGQPAKGGVKVTLIEDVFAASSGAGLAPPAPDDTLLNLVPLTQRVFDEAPWLLVQRAFLDGLISSSEQRVMGAVMAEAQGFAANRFHQDTVRTPSGGVPGALTADVGLQGIHAVAIVETDYARTAEPYDTATGLRITIAGLGTQAQAIFAAMLSSLSVNTFRIPDEIRFSFENLILVRPAGQTSGGELMAFESVTDNGGGSYTLNKVWRGEMDTVAVDIPAGSYVFWVYTADVGARPWLQNDTATATSYPDRLGLDGTGDDANDAIVVENRIGMPPPMADLGAAGFEVAGTAGQPQVAATSPSLGYFKKVTSLDGALDLIMRGRPIDPGQIVRGDETGWASDVGSTFGVTTQKIGGSEEETPFLDQPGGSAPTVQGVLLGASGHGEIDVIVRTFDVDGIQNWQDPKIRVTAASYRDLLGNGSFDYGALAPGWSSSAGAPAVINPGSASISHETNRHCLSASTITNVVVSEIVDIRGYKATGLDAICTFYVQQSSVGSALVILRALDSDQNEITTRTSVVATGASAGWTRYDLQWSGFPTYLPIDTSYIKVDVQLNHDVDLIANSARVSRVQLVVGQISNELIGSPGLFDTNLAGWTNVTNSFVWDSTNLDGFLYGPTGDPQGCARGGSFASSEIKLEAAIDAGFEHGVAVLTFARAHISAVGTVGDTGQVVLEALDGGGSVVASAQTTAEDLSSTPNIWKFRRVALTLPDTPAVTLRARLVATRAGATTCGAAFDNLSMRVFKHLDAPFVRTFDFSAPARAHAPNDWQAAHLAWPSLAIPVVFGGTSSVASVQPSDQKALSRQGWSDASADATHRGIFRGYFKTKQETPSDDLDCYVFNGAAPFIRSGGLVDDNYGKFTATDSFTVAVLMRSTPLAWSTASALCGRRDGTGIGWGLQVDALGRAKAVFQGASSTLSINSTDVVADRAPHWIFIKCDGTNMKLFTKAGTASTALVGLGSTTIAFQDFCIGIDGGSSNVFQGQIARVYIWNSALADADIQAIVAEVGADPSGKITTWTADKPVWVPGTPNAAGATLVRCGIADIPIAYEAGLNYGLALTRANTNALVTNDVNSNKWGGEAGTTLDRAVVDPTGLPMGVGVVQSVANRYLWILDMPAPLSAGSWTTVLWVRTDDSVSRNVDIELVDSNLVGKGAAVMAVTPLWQRFIMHHSWDGATPTAHLRLTCSSGLTGRFQVAHVLWSGMTDSAGDGPPPFAIQDGGVAISDTKASRTESLPVECNYEGELEVQALSNTGGEYFGSMASIDDGATEHNKRALLLNTGGAAYIQMFNAAGADLAVYPAVSAVALDDPFTVRARWNRLRIPDQLTLSYQAMAAQNDGDADSYTIDRAATTWSVNTTPNARIRIGGGIVSGTTSPNALIRKVVVRSREEKLTGG